MSKPNQNPPPEQPSATEKLPKLEVAGSTPVVRSKSQSQIGPTQACAQGGTPNAERTDLERALAWTLHDYLEEAHVRGEWFEREPALEELAELRLQIRVLGCIAYLADDFAGVHSGGAA